MSISAIAFTPLRSILCPITSLPPELREMIYQYYYEGMGLPKRAPFTTHIGHFRILKPYFSMLHFSSLVRSEIASEAYKAAFSDAWFRFKVEGEVNDVKRMRDTLTCIRTANKDIELGIRFTVSDYSRDELLRFVHSFFDTPMTEGNMKPSSVHYDDFVEASTLELSYMDSNTTNSKIEYTHKSRTGVYHELTGSGEYNEVYMFGKLARLDWSRFDFEFTALPQRKPHPQKKLHLEGKLKPKNKTRGVDERNKSHSAEDGIGMEFDSDHEIVALDSDDDKIEGILENSDVEVLLSDGEDEDSLLGSQCDDDGAQFDSEDGAFILDDGQEDWF